MKETKFWILHLFSGFVIFFLLLWHIFYMHYPVIMKGLNFGINFPLMFSQVTARAKSSGFKIAYTVFLIFALYHGFYGLKNLFIETKWGRKAEIPITVILSIIAIFLFIYGVFTTFKIGG